MMEFQKIDYSTLNARQKETYNFQKVSAVLADYGFATIRLYDDWEGADFIAQHIDGETYLKVQLKSRLSFAKKYLGKDLWITFPDPNGEHWYLYPHDLLLQEFLTDIQGTQSWDKDGAYTFKTLKKGFLDRVSKYKLRENA